MGATPHPTLSFSAKISTKIWHEQPCPQNPYLTERCRLHGYDIFDLAEQKSFIEVLYLLFRGELPDRNQAMLLEQLMIMLITPGPRHPASRAAMTAGISKTSAVNILPIGLMALSGEHLGAAEVEKSMKFLQSNLANNPQNLAKKLLSESECPDEGDWHIVPGFGSRFGDVDPIPNQFAQRLNKLNAGEAIKWGNTFASCLESVRMGWLSTGIAAAILSDLKMAPREGAGLFQLISAPGLLAQGMEQTHKPVTDMPFVKDENYVIE